MVASIGEKVSGRCFQFFITISSVRSVCLTTYKSSFLLPTIAYCLIILNSNISTYTYATPTTTTTTTTTYSNTNTQHYHSLLLSLKGILRVACHVIDTRCSYRTRSAGYKWFISRHLSLSS